MKKYITILVSIVIFFTSCKEQTPSGLLLTSLQSKDTTYVVSQAEIPQTKKILIEELTGVMCTNCPAGTSQLKGFMSQYPDKIVLVGIHSGFLTTPTPKSKYDFRVPDGDTLRLFFNEGDPSKPSATFDRVPATSGNSAGKYFISKGQTGADWITALNDRLSLSTPVNIHVESDYDATNSKINVKAKVHFTQNYSEKLALTMYVIENGIVDVQEDQALGEIEDYEFEHVFRKMITPVYGEPILDSLSTKEKGRVLEKAFSFSPKTDGANAWKLENCYLVAVVHRTGTSKEVLQAIEVKMKK